MTKQIIDITVPISTTTPVWPSDPTVAIRQMASISNGAESNLSQIRMSVHTGTHIDAPAHFLESGKTIGDIPLEKIVGEVLVIEIGESTEVVTERSLINHPEIKAIQRARKILLKTRNSRFWHENPTEFREDYVGIDTSGAKYLAKFDLDLIGIDYLSISPINDLEKPHQILLGKDIVLLEGVDLSQAPAGLYQLYCLPLKLESCEGAPARVILSAI